MGLKFSGRSTEMYAPAAVRAILARLERQHPDADTELHHRNAYELLVATILSAQSTDARVNTVTPALFTRYPDARALARATASELEPLIHATGFFRQKAKALIGVSQRLVEQHKGEVPPDMDALTSLPGVGRKTANVVLGHALGVPGLAVDRHVLRVANRIGIADSEDPETVEQQLTAALPPDRWTRASDTLILHGRRICRPAPLCDRCAVRDDCKYFRTLASDAGAGRNTSTAAGRPKPAPATERAARQTKRASKVKPATVAPVGSRGPKVAPAVAGAGSSRPKVAKPRRGRTK